MTLINFFLRSFLVFAALLVAGVVPLADAHGASTHSTKLAFYILNDPSQLDQDIQAVCCGEDVQWIPSDTVETSAGKGEVWIKLPDLIDGNVIEISASTAQATLFEKADDDARWHISHSGKQLPVAARSLPRPDLAFKLNSFSDNSVERYVKIDHFTRLRISLKSQSLAEFGNSSEFRFTVRTVLLGFCAAMIVFNILVSAVTRQIVFLLNAAMIASMILFSISASGLGSYLFWSDVPGLDQQIYRIAPGLIAVTSSLFVSNIIADGKIPSVITKLNRAFGVFLCGGYVLSVLANSIFLYGLLVNLGILLMFLQLLLLVTNYCVGTNKSAVFLLPAGILVSGFVIRWFTFLWDWNYGPLQEHVLEVTLALEAITFSLILASRIRFYAASAAEARFKLSELKIGSANRFAKLQDSDRSRLASELHDSLGHYLAMARAQMEKISQEKNLSIDTKERIAHANAIVGDAILETRRISHDLHPAKLDHLGLKQSMQEIFRDLEDLHEITYELYLDFSEPDFSIDDNMQIYRIVQEATSNIVRHSNATHCSLRIQTLNGVAFFELADDGVGFDHISGDEEKRGLGLFSTRQRVLLLGGELEIVSKKGIGVRLNFSFNPTLLK